MILKWLAVSTSVLVLVGCIGSSQEYDNKTMQTRLLCKIGTERVTVSPRLSYDLPAPFRNAACPSLVADFVYRKESGSVSVTIPSVINYGNVQAHSTSASMSINSYLGGTLFYPMDKFLEPRLAYMALPGTQRPPNSVEKRQVHGFACYRFYRVNDLPAVGIQGDEVEYWCWEKQSGLSIPFYVSASQSGKVGEPRGDLDQLYIEPLFRSLTIHPLPASTLADIRAKNATACAYAKSRFDQNLPWGDDYPDKRLALTRLHYCGYDVPLPDLKAPSP
ncbi:hypothetical protein P7C00_03590 [Pseudomonas sp. JDS08PS003]|uniref:hypothetical protein n=1 Tax=Pseudomonas sp. JDS08PS003 TaxID=2497162 RepID=UPI0038572F7F